MRPIIVDVLGTGNNSDPIALDQYVAPASVALSFQLINLGVGGTFNVQFINDDIFDSTFDPLTANWQNVTNLTGLTASAEGSIDLPYSALRLNISAGDGTTQGRLIVRQAGLVA